MTRAVSTAILLAGLCMTATGQIAVNTSLVGAVPEQTALAPSNAPPAVQRHHCHGYTNTGGGVAYRPNLVRAPRSNWQRHLVGCIDASAFSLPPAGTYVYGNAGRNLLHGPDCSIWISL